jgi:hypothetical protein
MEGLALAILGASVCMLIVPALVVGALGWFVARGRHGAIGAIVGALLGAVIGCIAVTATFFEDVWSPPAIVAIDAPAGFAHEWVYVVGDPTVSTELDWRGIDAPFMARHTTLTVPRSGVVRVRSLDRLDGGHVEATLSIAGSPARPSMGRAGLSLPHGFGSGRVVAFGFAPYPGREPEPPVDPAALAARVTELERER